MKYSCNLVGSCLIATILSACATDVSPGFVPASKNPSVTKTRKVFQYTGKKQLFTVPAGVTEITITADGASGAGTRSYAGGVGGVVKATVPVTSYEVLAVFVGGSGSDGGFNGGGEGVGARSYASSGGGGASDVRVRGTGERIVDAGGGGGAGASEGSTYTRNAILPQSGSPYGSGGNGGGSTGANGTNGSSGSYETLGGYGGYGGTQTSGGDGGAGGAGGSCSGGAGDSGSRYKGGTGGSGCFAGGGGGGGGYYGGGGGGSSDGQCGLTYYEEFGYCAWGGGGGGGGGSSFIEQAATTIKNIQGGAPVGDGQITISW